MKYYVYFSVLCLLVCDNTVLKDGISMEVKKKKKNK